ncbi:hypothetical protein ACQKPX_10360 [Photobacterium sp. DNB23_23_1]
MTIRSNILKFQIALFFSEVLTRPDRDFYNLDRTIDAFDTMPVMQPLPTGVEIDNYPVIKFTSKNGLFQCDVSQTRIDFYINHAACFGQYKFDVLHSEFRKYANALIEYVYNETTVRISRAGVVGDFGYFDSNPIKLLQDSQMKSTNDETVELQIRRNTPREYAGLYCNDIVNLSNGGYLLNNTLHPAIIIQKDINHRVDGKPMPLDVESLKQMVNQSIALLTENNFVEAL